MPINLFPPRTAKRLRLAAWLITLALVACSGNAQSSPTEFVYVLGPSPAGIDPHINASAELGVPLRSVYDTLVYRGTTIGGIRARSC